MASILDSFRLDGKVAIVTGASRGLGAAMAQALAEAGADLVLVARGDMAALQQSIAATGRRSVTVAADVGTPAAAAKIVAAAYEAFGRADILVNNAGIIRRANLLEFSETDWNDVLNVNLTGAFRLSQRFAAELVARKSPGKIINVASMLSFQGGILVPAYTASKSGIAGVTKALACEWAKEHININAIAPGYIATENTRPLREDESRNQSILARIPEGRWGNPEDIAGTCLFLSSADANYLNGTILNVDGGWLSR